MESIDDRRALLRLSRFSCENCRIIPNRNFFMCSRGHFVCWHCEYLLTRAQNWRNNRYWYCPISNCRGYIPDRRESVMLLMSVLLRAEFECVNSSVGCPIICPTILDLEDHQLKCKYSVPQQRQVPIWLYVLVFAVCLSAFCQQAASYFEKSSFR